MSARPPQEKAGGGGQDLTQGEGGRLLLILEARGGGQERTKIRRKGEGAPPLDLRDQVLQEAEAGVEVLPPEA